MECRGNKGDWYWPRDANMIINLLEIFRVFKVVWGVIQILNGFASDVVSNSLMADWAKTKPKQIGPLRSSYFSFPFSLETKTQWSERWKAGKAIERNILHIYLQHI